MSARDDRHLLRIAVNDRTTSSRQLAERWSTVTGVLMSASSIHRRLLHPGLPANESRLSLWHHDGGISVRQYADEGCLPESVIEQHSGLTPKVLVWGAISYHGRSNLHELKVFSLAIDCSRLLFSHNMQLLPYLAYSPDMSPIEHVWDLVAQRLARDPRPAASKYELLLRIQAIWNYLPLADIQNQFDSMSRRIVALIAARGG
ncbi:transposable element Tcb2 transposase [Trichonephila clavipes]|nr:transposable element Tcb2 transposase [Trichonephila clavipes]